jgi:hypothetical protein
VDIYDYTSNVVPSIHFHSVVKNKRYFVQSSYYIPVKMKENCCPVAKHEGNSVLDYTRNSDSECDLKTPVGRYINVPEEACQNFISGLSASSQ